MSTHMSESDVLEKFIAGFETHATYTVDGDAWGTRHKSLSRDGDKETGTHTVYPDLRGFGFG